MSRQYHERIEVQIGEPIQARLCESAVRAGPVESVPTAFLWRGRVHVVREVIAHWTQRLPWWSTAGAEEKAQQVLEQQVWRVEASAGVTADTGVYDLASGQHWQLIRIAD